MTADTTVTASLTREPVGKGDTNHDGQVNLTDAVSALQIIAGEPLSNINSETDANGDNKIGLAEVIYILQYVSELRYIPQWLYGNFRFFAVIR